ncbi:unnamed protein product [Plutella xylostella]|uniref:(diamondback moth) hypothetical protein n=1 Tax=Plutella xylostella TaxID=51655 RepID=A0A8S4FKG1_PLUXY|nr:unnamed protein product [Plutella xylostella]
MVMILAQSSRDTGMIYGYESLSGPCLLLAWLLLSGASLQREAQYPLRLADGTCQLKNNATGVQVASFTCDDIVSDSCLLLDWLLLSGASLQREAQYPLRLADGTCQLKKNATGVQVASFTCDDLVSGPCLLLAWLLLSGASLQREAQYPLRLADGTCQLKNNATGVQVASFTCDDFVGAEDKILQALATHGPVAVAVNALTWQNYLGGVIQFHCSGAASDLNHAVEIVGYDLTAEVPYYIAKNSWGPGFGNAGYIHLAVGSNICGLALEVSTVDVK